MTCYLVFLVTYLNHTGSFFVLLCLLALVLLFKPPAGHFPAQPVFLQAFSFNRPNSKNKSNTVRTNQKKRKKEKMKKRKIEEKYRKARENEIKPGQAEKSPTAADAPEIQVQTVEEKKVIRPEKCLPQKGEKLPSAEQSEPLAKSEEQGFLLPDLRKAGDYHFPPFSLLDPGKPSEKIDRNELFEKKRRIEEKLREFKVSGEVREYHPGPIITTYEFFPDAGIKVSQVAGLSEIIACPGGRISPNSAHTG